MVEIKYFGSPFYNKLIPTFLIMDFPRSGFIYLLLIFFFIEYYHWVYMRLLGRNQWLIGYQFSLIVIARQPKFHRFYALVITHFCANFSGENSGGLVSVYFFCMSWNNRTFNHLIPAVPTPGNEAPVQRRLRQTWELLESHWGLPWTTSWDEVEQIFF